MKSIIDGGLAVDLDFDRIIEGLERHLADVTGALNSFRRFKAWTTPPETAGVQTVCNHANSLEPTGFGAGHPLWANAYAILKAAGHPKSVAELAETMRENGVASRSSDFENTLNSVLSKRQDLFLRVASKRWGLVEWSRIEAQAPVVPLRITWPNGNDR